MQNICSYFDRSLFTENLSGENWFIIVSPKDIIIASSFDADERVEWLIDHW